MNTVAREPNLPANFFLNATLGDFYERNIPNPKTVELSAAQVKRWYSDPTIDSKVAEIERQQFAKTHGMDWVDIRRKNIGDPYYFQEKSPPQLTYWFPQFTERQLIFELAGSLASKDEKPFILEAACGSGVVSRLLAAENSIKVVGVDTDMVGMWSSLIPPTPGDIQFRDSDFWDVIEEFGPSYDKKVGQARQEQLQTIREETLLEPVFVLHALGSVEAQIGRAKRLNQEVEDLQTLASGYKEGSPVDIVLCSFMPVGVNLTIPVRDGIYPKAIVYVRPTCGMSGAGDYYTPGIFDSDAPKDAHELIPSPDTVISYNPGRNYRTAAKWITHCSNDWSHYINPPSFYTFFETEVVIQLRNDVVLGSSEISTRQYNFDKEFEQGFEEPEKYLKFIEGVQAAKMTLFSN